MSKPIWIFTLTFTLCLWLIDGHAQEKRIFYTSTEIQQEPITPRIKTIRGVIHSSFLRVQYEDGTQKRIAIKDVWGYSDKGTLCRRVGKVFLAVISQQADLIEYRGMLVPRYDGMTKTTKWEDGPHYFSKTLDSKLYQSKQAALDSE